MSLFKSALVTGGTGFLGTVLIDRLLAGGVEVVALVRATSRAEQLQARPNVRLVIANTWDAAHLKSALVGITADVVFHLASYGVQPSDDNPADLIQGNVGLVASLLQAASNWPLRWFVHAGSCSEYGFPDGEHTLIGETHPLRPTSTYGAAKAASSLFGSALARRLGIPFLTLRFFGIYGPHEGPQRLIPYLIRHLERDLKVDLTPGEQVRDFLFEEDAAAALASAAQSDAIAPYNVFNVCSAIPIRIREIGEHVADRMGKPRELLRWGDRPYRGDEPFWLVGDNSHFLSASEWRPTVSLESGIERTIRSRRMKDPEG